jgi:O-acetyl-ADP-ribose deacetylase (regulator of RNase III)
VKEWIFDNRILRIVKGNIVQLNVDAIVNAANKSLILGGGVAGAIRTYGGPSIQEECNRIGPIEVGEAVITHGGQLKADHVIHAAGPVLGEGNEEDKLEKATVNSLKLASKEKIHSIAFPAISTGIFRFPIKKCSAIMLRTAIDYLRKNERPSEIVFCLFGDEPYSVFLKTMQKMMSDTRTI